jgi:acyl-coenzyme A thioesterase PaaI-like protein
MSATIEESPNPSAQNGHARCFLCGNLNPRSFKLAFRKTGDGVVQAHFKAHAGLQGYDGILHGGVIAALLDAAMTHCLFHHGVPAVTGDLHVRFVQAVPCNAFLTIRAWVLSFKPPLYRLRAEIDVAGRVMAWAEAKFMQRTNRSLPETGENDGRSKGKNEKK